VGPIAARAASAGRPSYRRRIGIPVCRGGACHAAPALPLIHMLERPTLPKQPERFFR
jgi:hypothetical protein